MKFRALLPLALFACFGCYSAPVVPPPGFIFSDVSAPMDVDMEASKINMASGMAASASVLGLVAWGDCSVTAAANAGNLQQVDQVDYHFFNVLGVYQKFTTIAYGSQ